MKPRKEDRHHEQDARPPYYPWLHDPDENGVWCQKSEDEDNYLEYSNSQRTYELELTIPYDDAMATLRMQGAPLWQPTSKSEAEIKGLALNTDR
jgi:hypothetical protein